jgi:hypothetical protein
MAFLFVGGVVAVFCLMMLPGVRQLVKAVWNKVRGK